MLSATSGVYLEVFVNYSVYLRLKENDEALIFMSIVLMLIFITITFIMIAYVCSKIKKME